MASNLKTHCLRGHALEPGNLYYYPRPNGTTGRACIACTRIRSAAHWLEYSKTDVYKASNKRRSRKQLVEKRHTAIAHKAVWWAIKVGKLVRPDECSQQSDNCTGRIEGHHDDYTKKLEVRWLCKRCHMKAHGIKFGDSNDQK